MAYIGNGVGRSQIVAGQIAPSAVGYEELNVPEMSGTIAGYKNKIINPKAVIRQRGTPATTGTAYGPDRWQLGLNGLSATLHVADDATASFNGASHLYLQCTTAKASLATGDHAYVMQKVEGSNMADFMMGYAEAKTFTLSFSAIAGAGADPFTMSVSFRNEATNRSYVTSVTITGAKKRYSVTVPGDVTGTWNSGTGTGLVVGFCGSSGATYTTSSTNQWLAGNYIAATGQGNLHAVLNQYVNISDVQLEAGSVATEFENRPIGIELSLCQRYYQFMSQCQVGGNTCTSTTNMTTAMIVFPVPMRATPSCTTSSITYAACTGLVVNGASINCAQTYLTGTTTNNNAFAVFNLAANAEL